MKTMNKTRLPTAKKRANVLRFSPTAWAKLLYLRDLGDTEIGGFGISSQHDLLYVEDIVLVTQVCTAVSVEFADAAVADYFDAQIEAGRKPEQFARIWVHTHPGTSARPSSIDEQTFERVFGRTDWALMFILARGGQTYARLRYHVGPHSDVELAVEVDYQHSFPGTDQAAWEEEYHANVSSWEEETTRSFEHSANDSRFDDWWYDAWQEYELDREVAYGN